jgi:hypothetical protein
MIDARSTSTYFIKLETIIILLASKQYAIFGSGNARKIVVEKIHYVYVLMKERMNPCLLTVCGQHICNETST